MKKLQFQNNANWLLILVIATLFLSADLFSQNKQEDDDGYSRNSISCFYLGIPGESMSAKIAVKVSGSTLSYDRFFDNNLENKILKSPYSRSNIDASGSGLVKNLLEKEQIAHKIVSQMYKRQADGSLSLDLIHERGRYNATDADVLKARSIKRGESELADFGDSLINRSYILVVDFKNVKNAREYSSNAKGWSATIKGYLYRINFTPQVRKSVNESWIYEDDSAQERERKKLIFDNINFPVEYVTEYETNITEFVTGELSRYHTDDDLLDKLVSTGFGTALGSISVYYDDFQVKASIYKTHPIRSKIGRKEGVQLDDLYYVYEHQLNEKSGNVEKKFKGTIRATNKIGANNRVSDGSSPTTKFYQTYGRALKPGYSMVFMGMRKGDFKMGYETGNVGGIFFRMDARVSRILKIRSSFAFLDVAFESKKYDIPYEFGLTRVSFLRYGFGLSKGIMLTRNIELAPYVGCGYENASSNTFDNTDLEGVKTLYVKYGGTISINLSVKWKIFGGMGYYSPLGNPVNKNKQELSSSWSSIFSGRMGQSILFGIQYDTQF